MRPGYTGPSSRPQLYSSRIMCDPALPTAEIVLPEKHAIAGPFGPILCAYEATALG